MPLYFFFQILNVEITTVPSRGNCFEYKYSPLLLLLFGKLYQFLCLVIQCSTSILVRIDPCINQVAIVLVVLYFKTIHSKLTLQKPAWSCMVLQWDEVSKRARLNGWMVEGKHLKSLCLTGECNLEYSCHSKCSYIVS